MKSDENEMKVIMPKPGAQRIVKSLKQHGDLPPTFKDSIGGAMRNAPENVTRRNPEMERYTEIMPCVVEGFPDAHTVWLKVPNQSFCIGAHASETKEEAEWLRDMLCVALAKVVADNK